MDLLVRFIPFLTCTSKNSVKNCIESISKPDLNYFPQMLPRVRNCFISYSDMINERSKDRLIHGLIGLT